VGDRTFLTAEWRHLAMLNFAIDADLLRPRVPFGTELDFFNGRAYISLVGFRFLNTKLLGVPIPFHRDFDEVNLRFYVRSREGRRGVVFIKEIVPKRAIAAVARAAYNENYIARPMWHEVEPTRVRYGWKNGDSPCQIEIEVAGDPAPAAEGSEEQFITEHYWGYSSQRDGGSVEYQVKHEPWLLRRGISAHFEGDTTSLYGLRFAAILRREPDSAFLAEGSPVEVLRGARL
jgi:uncharacterized protein